MFPYLDKLKHDNVYIAIGSAPHCSLNQYNDERNQMLPKFIRELGGTWTLINVDPMFEQPTQKAFVDSYFKRMGFYQESPYVYTRQNADALFIPLTMENEQKLEFLTKMTRKVMGTGKKLVVQEFTGHELFLSFQGIVRKLPAEEREYVKKNVLWDITYGKECGCSTNMNIWKPLFVDDGFLNLACMTTNELVATIGKNPDIDKLISHTFKCEYTRLINVHHVNYRRKLKGLDLYWPTPEYGDNVSGERIMEIFMAELYPITSVLKRVSGLSEENYAKQMDMMNNYHLYDIYEWYSTMKGIYDQLVTMT